MPQTPTGYLHGYSEKERERLHFQARFLEPVLYERLPYRRRKRLLEVGSGVGAPTEILLRRFPDLHVTGIEINDAQIAEARRFLETVPFAKTKDGSDRFTIVKGDATQLELPPASFDGAFLCWVLEHVGDPARVLSEVRRMLVPGSPIVCSEVLNATFFIDPYSPDTLRYWTAFNEHQLSVGGDPFVGAKLGNLLQSVGGRADSHGHTGSDHARPGFRDVVTEVKSFHLDNRDPVERAEFLAYWSDLLLSGAPALLETKRVSEETVEGMRKELARVGRDPNSVFFYAFIQAQARAW